MPATPPTNWQSLTDLTDAQRAAYGSYYQSKDAVRRADAWNRRVDAKIAEARKTVGHDNLAVLDRILKGL